MTAIIEEATVREDALRLAQCGDHDAFAALVEEHEAMVRLLRALPGSQQIAITLRYQEELDPAEIARILGIPVRTVKSHLYRGLRALRKKLGER